MDLQLQEKVALITGGVNGLTREWAVELAAQGVRADCVLPAETGTLLYERFLDVMPDPVAAKSEIERLIPLGHRSLRSQRHDAQRRCKLWCGFQVTHLPNAIHS